MGCPRIAGRREVTVSQTDSSQFYRFLCRGCGSRAAMSLRARQLSFQIVISDFRGGCLYRTELFSGRRSRPCRSIPPADRTSGGWNLHIREPGRNGRAAGRQPLPVSARPRGNGWAKRRPVRRGRTGCGGRGEAARGRRCPERSRPGAAGGGEDLECPAPRSPRGAGFLCEIYRQDGRCGASV